MLLAQASFHTNAQKINAQTFMSSDIFQTNYFIENLGQFKTLSEDKLPTLFCVDNKSDQISLYRNGWVWELSDKLNCHLDEKEDLGEKEAKWAKSTSSQRINMCWLNPNVQCGIDAIGKSKHYFTYGERKYNSYGFEKVVYKSLYPNIDVEYIIPKKGGIKYSIILNPKSDIQDVKFKYSGVDVKIKLVDDKLFISSGGLGLVESGLNAFYENGTSIKCKFSVNQNEIGFEFLEPIDIDRKIIIDPWVSTLLAFSEPGFEECQGFDVDFDYQGNLYVYGSSEWVGKPKVAKYSNTGTLLWTFNGVLVSPTWVSAPYSGTGNFCFDRKVDKVYISQGFDPIDGVEIIRLDADGVYDNFITSTSLNFCEVWDFSFDCATGDLLALGGGIKGNHNIGRINSSGITTETNITGYPLPYQDIVNTTISNNGKMYALTTSGSTPQINNTLLEINSSINGNNWIAPTGYSSFVEGQNKYYVGGTSSNGFNALYTNSKYLYCYDGINVAAYQLNNGSMVGIPIAISSHDLKRQGGIYVDPCDNVFVGGNNGNILVYHFDGVNFNLQPEITIPNAVGKNIYDLKFNRNENLLYISGEEFVATVALTPLCTDTNLLNVTIEIQCNNAIAMVIPNDSLSNYKFVWTDSNTNMIVQTTANSSKQTDTLKNPIPGHVYHLLVIHNEKCDGEYKIIRVEITGTKDTLEQEIKLCHGDYYEINNHKYFKSGIYVDTILNDKGCIEIMITKIEMNESEESAFFIPNSFTPNNDNLNDCFGVWYWKNIQAFKMIIYNRWGEVVFHTTNNSECWDGKLRNRPAESGIYFYLISVSTSCSNQIFKGDLTLIR